MSNWGVFQAVTCYFVYELLDLLDDVVNCLRQGLDNLFVSAHEGSHGFHRLSAISVPDHTLVDVFRNARHAERFIGPVKNTKCSSSELSTKNIKMLHFSNTDSDAKENIRFSRDKRQGIN